MRRTFHGFAVMLISGFCLLLNSCLEEACIEETEAYVKAGFYSYSTRQQSIPDSITLYGIGKDSNKIYNAVKVTPPALMPLRDSANYSAFIIKINGVADTLEFSYWSYPHLVTKECGYTFFHTIDTIYHTKHAIVSVSKTNNNVTTFNGENMRIYY